MQKWIALLLRFSQKKKKNRFMAKIRIGLWLSTTLVFLIRIFTVHSREKKILNILVFLICSKIIEKINRQQHRSYYNQNDEEERTSTLKHFKVNTAWNFIKIPTKFLASFCRLFSSLRIVAHCQMQTKI